MKAPLQPAAAAAPSGQDPAAAAGERYPWEPSRSRNRFPAGTACAACCCAGSRAGAADEAATIDWDRPESAGRLRPIDCSLPMASRDFGPHFFGEDLHLLDQLGDAVGGEE